MAGLTGLRVGDDGARAASTLSVQLCLPFMTAVPLNEPNGDASVMSLPPHPQNANGELRMETPSFAELLDLSG